MYEHFFGCRERPFDLTPNPRYLVLTDSHREALSNLEYGISSKKGITLLIGEAGSGKTTVIRTALDRQADRVHAVHISNPTLSRAEFVETLAARFELSEQARSSKATMLAELETLLRARREANETTVLVIDEAQSLPIDLLEEIRLLVNIETDEEKLLSVIIAGQPELVDVLNNQALRQLKQRVALRCELRPLTRQETAAYLAGRIRAAGGVGAQVFTREAVTLIHDHSGGLPRTISVIADNALLGGFAAGQRPVNSEIVAEICRDFDIARNGKKPVNGVAALQPGGEKTAPAIMLNGSSAHADPPAAQNGHPVAGQRLFVVNQVVPQAPAQSSDATVPPDKHPGVLAALKAKGKRFSFFRS